MPEFEVTARPGTVDINDKLLSAVVATEGKKEEAIKIKFALGENLDDVRGGLRKGLKTLGLKLRYKYNKVEKSLTVYAEKVDTANDSFEDDERDKDTLQ